MSDFIFGLMLTSVWVATLSGMVWAIFDAAKCSKKWNCPSFYFMGILLACTILASGCVFHWLIVGIHAGTFR